MTFPVIHDNGSGRTNLKTGWCDAYAVLSTAYDQLKKCGPNARDYGPKELAAAVQEHRSRLQRIADVMDELETLCIHVDSD